MKSYHKLNNKKQGLLHSNYKYGALFMGAIKGANKADKKGRYGPAPSMSIDCGMTP